MLILQFSMPTWWTSDYSALYSGEKVTINVDCIKMRKCFACPTTTLESIKRNHEVKLFFAGAPIKVMWLYKKDCCLLGTVMPNIGMRS
jgi:hypothetical protein